MSKRSDIYDSLLAHHEAGHAVAAWALGRPIALLKINPHDGCGVMLRELPAAGATQKDAAEQTPELADLCERARSLIGMGKSRIPAAEFIIGAIDRGIELMAGPEAERKLSGGLDSRFGRADIDQAEHYAFAISVCREAGWHYLGLFRREARCIIDCHWHSVVAVASALLQHEVLTGSEVFAIIAGAEEAHRVADVKRVA